MTKIMLKPANTQIKNRNIATTPANLSCEGWYDRINLVLEDRDITPQDIANVTGVSRVTAARYLKGETKAPLTFVVAVINYLQLDPNWVIFNYIPVAALEILDPAHVPSDPAAVSKS